MTSSTFSRLWACNVFVCASTNLCLAYIYDSDNHKKIIIQWDTVDCRKVDTDTTIKFVPNKKRWKLIIKSKCPFSDCEVS